MDGFNGGSEVTRLHSLDGKFCLVPFTLIMNIATPSVYLQYWYVLLVWKFFCSPSLLQSLQGMRPIKEMGGLTCKLIELF